jgi:hypothetical protein
VSELAYRTRLSLNCDDDGFCHRFVLGWKTCLFVIGKLQRGTVHHEAVRLFSRIYVPRKESDVDVFLVMLVVLNELGGDV